MIILIKLIRFLILFKKGNKICVKGRFNTNIFLNGVLVEILLNVSRDVKFSLTGGELMKAVL